MQNKLFAVALLCSISFNVLQASQGNPYGIGQESTRQPRYIRVITEIPVEMAGFMMPRQGYGYPGASESKTAESLLDSSAKRSATEEAILQLIKALTKKLTIPENDSEEQPVFGVVPREIAREAADAEAAKNAAKTAEVEAKAAEKAAADAKEKRAADIGVKELDALVKRARAEKLMTKATSSVAVLNTAAMDMLKTAGSPLTYAETPPTAAVASRVREALTAHFDTLSPDRRKTLLDDKYNNIMSSYANAPLTSIVTQAEIVMKTLRDQGASFGSIADYLSSRVKDAQTKLASRALGLDGRSALSPDTVAYTEQTKRDFIISAMAYNAAAAITGARPLRVNNYVAY